MGIFSKAVEFGRPAVATVAHAGEKVLALGSKKLMSLACVAALAVTAVPALAEDPATGGSTGGSTSTAAWTAAKNAANDAFNVGQFAKGSYETCAETIGAVAPYLIMLGVIGVAIAWVWKLLRQGKKN